MEDSNLDLEKDLAEQYATLEEEIAEDKKKKRLLLVFIFFLSLFLIMFGTTFSYFSLYSREKTEIIIVEDLYIENYKDAFIFDPEINSYTINVPSGTKSVKVVYNLSDKSYKVEIIGADNLNPGLNEIKVIISDENGIVKEYVIYVVVEENTEKVDNDLSLKSLKVTNHEINNPFDRDLTTYIVYDVYENENSIIIDFSLVNKENNVDIYLNGHKVSRSINKNGDINTLKLNVGTELVIGANKIEIRVYDNEGNEKIYHLIIVVNKIDKEDQKVVELIVDYQNENGLYQFANIIPGWVSSPNQQMKVTNKSNYDTYINIDFIQVKNTFTNKEDLKYSLYEDNKLIKSGILPSTDENMISNIKILSNSDTTFEIKYEYVFSELDQNIDQGKEFESIINISLSN